MNEIPYIIADVARDAPDGECYYLFRRDLNQGFQLDGYAAELVRRFDGTRTVNQIIKAMVAEFRLPPKQFEADAKALIKDLETHTLLKWLSEPVRS